MTVAIALASIGVGCVPAPVGGGPYVSLQPCGGDLPPCYVKERESGGDYRAVSPSGAYRGAWQFGAETWGGFGGYELADQAPPSVQDERAREVWAGGAGCSNWSAC